MSQSPYNYEISDIEKNTIAEIKKHFTSKRNTFFFGENGYYLNLIDSKYTKLPDYVKNLTHLIDIDFSYNNIHEFPKILTEMPQLKKIRLSENKISNIPKEICNIKNLILLRLSENRITKIPDWIGDLKNLRELYLGKNQIAEIPDWIGDLKHLRVLDLGDNYIAKISKHIGKLQRLCHLLLPDNHIKEIPHELGHIKNLSKLDLDNNEIEVLPESFKNLNELQHLNISNNKIKTLINIPKSQALRWFHCNYNLLESFDGFDPVNNFNFEFLGNQIKSFYGVTEHFLKTILTSITYFKEIYNCFNLSKTGQKLLTDLLKPKELFSDRLYLIINSDFQEKFEKFYNFYKKSPDEILQNLINQKSVSLENMERLVHEGGLTHRHLLENILPKAHPIFELYRKKFSYNSKTGLKILI